MKDIADKILELRKEEEKLDAERETVLRNSCVGLETQLAAKENEMERARTEEQKAWYERYIDDIKRNIKETTDKIEEIYYEKKKILSLRFLEQMQSTALIVREKTESLMKDSNEKLEEICTLIDEKNKQHDFSEVIRLSNEAKVYEFEISNMNDNLDKLNSLMSKIDYMINNFSSVKRDDIENLIGELIDVLKEFDPSIFKPEKPHSLDEELVKNINEAKEALYKARNSLTTDDLNDAIRLINNLPEDEKNKMQAEVSEIETLINNKKLICDAKDALAAALSEVSKERWIKAFETIEKLPEGSDKDELTGKINKLYEDNKNRVENLADELVCSTNPTEDEIEELAKRYDILISYATIDDELKEKVTNSIMNYNAILQDRKAQDEALNGGQKMGLKARLIEFFGFPISAILKSKFYGKVLKRKIEKAKNDGNDEAVKKYEKRNSERDIVSGVTLYKSLDDLAALKTKLYKNGDKPLSARLTRKYNRKASMAAKKIENGINSRLNKEEDLILSDRNRTINIVEQYMQMLAVYDLKQNDKKKKKENISRNIR